MTIGAGTFSPSAKFSLPRSYVYDFIFNRFGDTVTQVDNVFTLHAVPPDPTFAVIVFNPKLWLWNSNVYTLDFIITESWYKAGGVGAETPLPFSLSYVPCPPSKRPSLEYAFFGLIGDPETFTLPVQPPNWYSPPPLP